MSTGSIPNVEVWVVRLVSGAAARGLFRSYLSPQELARSKRFVHDRLTASYEVSHGVLRVLLSRYLGGKPTDVEFSSNAAGKPRVALRASNWKFNMSHSGELAAYAFTTQAEVGIDIERVRALPDLEAIAGRFFCKAETAELVSIADDLERREAFYRCWTRKESYIKAIGRGLAEPLDAFQVSLLPGEAPRLVRIGQDADAGAAWTLHHLEPAPGYVGALAHPGTGIAMEVHRLRDAAELLA